MLSFTMSFLFSLMSEYIFILIYLITSILQKRFFEIPIDGGVEKWILQSVVRKWKENKFELKSKYFKADKTREEIEKSIPIGFFPNQWKAMVHYWFSEKSMVTIMPLNLRDKFSFF
ncbi:hypothetical protein Syun_021096 [Stephania yunnanensis]|uniref:Uncharacterized protein n=1 Tax=Stephania yunnanensis TaxID=152371 RepID=A0AAP0IF12_9MAGN